MSYLYEINTGTTHPSKVIKLRSLKSPLIYKFIVFQINSSNFKGTVKWFGEINDIRAFGIETDPIDMGTNGELNNSKIFNYKPECGILIEESVKYLETDELHGFVKYNEFKVDKKYSNSKSRLVYVRFKNECRIGRILNRGFINEIICFRIEILKESIEYFVIIEDLLDFVNDDGIVLFRKDAVLNIEDCNEDFSLIIDKRIRFRYNNNDEMGVLKWKGKIDGLKCIGVEPYNANLISDWKKYFNRNAYRTMICLDFLENKGISIMFEIEDPFNHDIFTYLKKKTFVKIKGDYGTITSYFTDKKNLFYEIKTDDDKFVIANCNNVKCGAVAKNENKSFVTMKSPDDHGVLTKFNINDYVEVKPDLKNKLDKSCFGFLVWMGFDGDRSLKFLINLEYPNECASSGTFYGQKLHDIKNKHGLLVYPDCLIPFGHVPGNEYEASSQESSTVDGYQVPCSKFTCGENKGIQGNKDSCYIETSLFAMFTFQELFDNLFILPRDEINQEIVNILGKKIVFPLRKYGYVSFSRVSEFRHILAMLYPKANFLCSEQDPAEFLEILFRQLIPQDPLLRIFDIKSKNCINYFTTQLFCTNRNIYCVTTIKEMLIRTFLESGNLMDKPPKCLILQLPRYGKQYSEVEISSTLDITNLVRCGDHNCTQCTKNGTILCLSCSEEEVNFTYYCDDHKTHCTHPDKPIIFDDNSIFFKGKIKLELFAILCIEKTRYVAYVKTGEFSDKWIYYDSMATSDKHVLKPLIRETSIGKYFSKNFYHSNIDEDLNRIRKFAFLCFYKNSTLEYFYTDFNQVQK